MALRLDVIGFDLQRALHPPAGGYASAVHEGNLLHLAGHGPLLDGAPAHRGRVPTEVTVAEAVAAARLTAINCLATIQDVLGSLERVAGFVRVFGMVNAEPGFTQHPAVLDGASQLLAEVFGAERARHARSAVGMGSLPFDIPVEIEMTVRVAEGDPLTSAT